MLLPKLRNYMATLLFELNTSLAHAPILWCENIGATYLSANPVFHARTKHVETNFNFVRHKVVWCVIREERFSVRAAWDYFRTSFPVVS